MAQKSSLLSWARLQSSWKFYKALQADSTCQWELGLRCLDEAELIGPLDSAARVLRGMLLLGSGRSGKAQAALNTLVADFDGSNCPDHRYLQSYCEAQLESIWRGVCPAEAGKVAPIIPGTSPFLQKRFPIPDCHYCDVIRKLHQ